MDVVDEDNPATVGSLVIWLAATVFVTVAILFVHRLRVSAAPNKSNAVGGRHTDRRQQTKSSKGDNGHRLGATSNNRRAQKQTKKQQQQQPKRSLDDGNFVHRWLATTLKGHSGRVLDFEFSDDHRYLISCDDDRKIFLWSTKEDFAEKVHKFSRVNVDLDHAVRVKWLPDTKGFLAFVAQGRRVTSYRTSKRSDASVTAVTPPTLEFDRLDDYDVAYHDDDDDDYDDDYDLVGLGVASTGRYAMTCTGRGATLVIWNLKGQKLASVKSKSRCHCAEVSPCARFVGAAGLTGVVVVWSVVFRKTGDFQEVSKAFELTGHAAAVLAFAFNGDSSRMASVSKDGTWRMWRTDGSDPCVLLSGQCVPRPGPVRLALSPDGRVIAVTAAGHLQLLSAPAVGDATIDCQGDISQVTFDPSGRRIAVAIGRHVRLFHNVVGMRALIEDLEAAHKSAATGQSTRERIAVQIADARSRLAAVLGAQE